MIPKLLHGVHSSQAPSILDYNEFSTFISSRPSLPYPLYPFCLLPSESTPQQQNFWLSHQAFEQCPSLKSDSHSVQMAINAALIPITTPNNETNQGPQKGVSKRVVADEIVSLGVFQGSPTNGVLAPTAWTSQHTKSSRSKLDLPTKDTTSHACPASYDSTR